MQIPSKASVLGVCVHAQLFLFGSRPLQRQFQKRFELSRRYTVSGDAAVQFEFCGQEALTPLCACASPKRSSMILQATCWSATMVSWDLSLTTITVLHLPSLAYPDSFHRNGSVNPGRVDRIASSL